MKPYESFGCTKLLLIMIIKENNYLYGKLSDKNKGTLFEIYFKFDNEFEGKYVLKCPHSPITNALEVLFQFCSSLPKLRMFCVLVTLYLKFHFFS